MGTMGSQISNLTIVYSTVIQAQMKENIKAPRHWPLWEKFTGDRWIPRKKVVPTISKSFEFCFDWLLHRWLDWTQLWYAVAYSNKDPNSAI